MAKPFKPILAKWDPDLDGWTWGLHRSDFMRIQAGYGCARCLEPFEYWVPVCPVCGHENEVEFDPKPREWEGR